MTRILCNNKAHYHVQDGPLTVSVLSQNNQAINILPYFFKNLFSMKLVRLVFEQSHIILLTTDSLPMLYFSLDGSKYDYTSFLGTLLRLLTLINFSA